MSTAVIVDAIVLAGGRGQRVGERDKGLLNFRCQPLIEQVINRVQPQVRQIVLSVNRNLDRYKTLNLPLVTDPDPAFYGPLSGICSALRFLQETQQPAPDWILLAPCDTPFYPLNMVAYLLEGFRTASKGDAAKTDTQCLLPYDGQRYQPLCGLLRPQALPTCSPSPRS